MKKIPCRLCLGKADFAFQKKILNKYDIDYFQCDVCGALQTEDPFWLDEAYQPINERLDTGQFIRSLLNAAFLSAVYSYLNLTDEPLVDYGCGSGLTGRILRDIGINAYGYDTYSNPRLLMGFQRKKLGDAYVINMCEVAEHFPDPRSSFDHVFSCNPSMVIVQTEIFHNVDKEWGYLTPEHGQHIFFYSEKTLSFLAEKYQMAATYIQGFVIFIKPELLQRFFINDNLREGFIATINQAMPELLNKILSNGYKFAINDYQMLISEMRGRNS